MKIVDSSNVSATILRTRTYFCTWFLITSLNDPRPVLTSAMLSHGSSWSRLFGHRKSWSLSRSFWVWSSFKVTWPRVFKFFNNGTKEKAFICFVLWKLCWKHIHTWSCQHTRGVADSLISVKLKNKKKSSLKKSPSAAQWHALQLWHKTVVQEGCADGSSIWSCFRVFYETSTRMKKTVNHEGVCFYCLNNFTGDYVWLSGELPPLHWC